MSDIKARFEFYPDDSGFLAKHVRAELLKRKRLDPTLLDNRSWRSALSLTEAEGSTMLDELA
jgi:hypothetical protein